MSQPWGEGPIGGREKKKSGHPESNEAGGRGKVCAPNQVSFPDWLAGEAFLSQQFSARHAKIIL